ncbi:MAG: phosphatase PAP2 family protein [Gaiellales bacterium]
MRHPWLDRVVVPYTISGNYGILWVAIGAGAGQPVRLAATVWGTLAANYAVKQAVRRERPGGPDGRPLVRLPSSSSFPSSHAAMSTAAAIALTRARPGLVPLWVAMAAVMCASRVYVGAHHPSDVLAGIAVGAMGGAISVAV